MKPVKLEHGKTYRNRIGQAVTVTARPGFYSIYTFLGSDGHTYTDVGLLNDGLESELDLVELASNKWRVEVENFDDRKGELWIVTDGNVRFLTEREVNAVRLCDLLNREGASR